LENLQDIRLDLLIMGSCRGLFAKPPSSTSGPNRGQGEASRRRLWWLRAPAAGALGARAPREKEEGNEGIKMECSPAVEGGEDD
jgi:hypothetical protein